MIANNNNYYVNKNSEDRLILSDDLSMENENENYLVNYKLGERSKANLDNPIKFQSFLNAAVFFSSLILGLKIQYDLSPITKNLYYIFDLEPYDLSQAINLCLLVSFIFGFMLNYFIDKYGCKASLITSNLIYTLSAVSRLLIAKNYYAIYVSYALIGISAPLTYNSVTKMVKISFPLNTRGLASTVSSLAIPIGGVLGIFYAGIFCDYLDVDYDFDEDLATQQLYKFFYSDILLQLMCLMLSILVFKEMHDYDDESDASNASYDGRQFVVDCLRLVRNKHYMLQTLAYGLYWAMISTMMGQIGLLFSVYDFDQALGNLYFAVGMVCAVFSSVACGRIVDRYKNYKHLLTLLYGASILAVVLMLACAQAGLQTGFFLACAGLVVLASGTKGLNFELSAEQTYPIKPGNSTGFMVNFNILFSFFTGEAVTRLLGNYDNIAEDQLQHNLCFFYALFTCIVVITFILSFIMKQKLRRTNCIQKEQQEIRKNQKL